MSAFDVVGSVHDWSYSPKTKTWEKQFPNDCIGQIQLCSVGNEWVYNCYVMGLNRKPFFMTRRDTYSEAKDCVDEHARYGQDD